MRRKQIACADVLEYIVQEVREIRKDLGWRKSHKSERWFYKTW